MKKQNTKFSTIVPVFLVFVMLAPALLWAQGSTGKITGIVVDAQTNEALPGANVVIEGTSRGASTDAEGRYFIMAIPPGVYSLRTTYMGYTKMVKEEIRVSIGRTTTINFELNQIAITGEEVIVIAERERVRTDVSFTQNSLGEEEIRLAPVGVQLREVLRTQAGVELDDQGRLSIRGSGYDEVGFVVDGVNQNDARFNVAFTNVPKAAIKEVQVLTGGFNAEYGEARSGLINIVTKEGGNTHHGTLHMRYRPSGLKHRGPNVYSPENYWNVGRYLSMEPTGDLNEDGKVDFEGWRARFEQGLNQPVFQAGPQEEWKNPATPEEALEIWKWYHRGFDYGNEPDYYLEGTLGGPVPGTPIKYFFSGFYNKEMFVFPMIQPDYVEFNTSLKLTWDVTPNLKIKLLGDYGEVHTASHTYLGGSPDVKQYNVQSKFANMSWDNAIYQGNMSFGGNELYNLHSRMGLYYIDRANIGTHVTWIKSPKTFVEFQFNKSHSVYGTPRWPTRRDLNTVAKQVGEVMLTETPDDYFVEYWANRDQLGAYKLAGARGFSDFTKTRTYRSRLDWTSQVSSNHQLKAGLSFNYYFLDMKYGENSQAFNAKGVEHQRNWAERNAKESEWAAYIQDKIEFKGLIMNLGLRVDGFAPLSKALVNDFDPNTTAEYNYFGLYDELPPRGLYEEVPYQNRGYRQSPGVHWAISPRVGVSHPIGNNSKLYFNYGYFYQRPVIFNQYADVMNRRGNLDYLGNPYLDFTKTINYELGIEQNLFSNFLLRISGYYRDIARAWGRTRIQTSRTETTTNYRTYLNNRYGDIRGVEITLEKQGRYITGRINYDYMMTSSGFIGQTWYSSDPNDIMVRTDFFNPVAEALVARPRLNAMLTFHTPSSSSKLWLKPFTNASLTVYFRYKAGRHFTYHGSPKWPGTDERDPNNVQWKDDYRTDLRLQKAIQIGSFRMRPYLEVTNVFDYIYFYLPEGTGAGFGFSSNEWTNYMDWVKDNDKTPGDHQGVPNNAYPAKFFLLLNQPRDYRFGIEFDL